MDTLIQAIEKHREQLSFHSIDISTHLPGYYNFVCTATLGNQQVHGHGLSSSKNAAFMASVAEVLERIVFQQTDFATTSGFAAHTDYDKACQNAIFELIERDLLLCYYHSGTSIPDVTAEMCLKHAKIKFLNERIANAGKSLKLGCLHKKNGIFSFLAAIHPVRDGTTLGASCGQNQEAAAEKAVLEAFMNALIADRIYSPVELQDFLSLPENESRSAIMHLRLGLDRTVAQPFIHQFSKSAKAQEWPVHLDKFKTTELHLTEIFSAFPFRVVRASNDHLQPLYFGSHVTKSLQKNRFQEIGLEPRCITPHIFG